MPHRVTMSDVAQQAGVSLMTVSRVVNDKGDVSAETRQRVQQVIEELGYRPSGIARSLATQRTGTIGLVVPDIANPYFSGMAHGITEVAYTEGFGVLLCDCEEDPERELEMLDVLDEKRVDGVIVAGPRVDSQRLIPALAQHPNVVIVNRQFDTRNHSTASGYVVNNDEAGGREITRLLLEHGHKTVGFLAGPKMSYGSQRRLSGYKEALANAHIPFDPNLIQYCSPTVAGGREATLQMLTNQRSGSHISSLFCFNDLVAIGALQACNELDKKVPEDLAIVGYDDIPMAAWVNPPLTTCHVAFEEMGRLAMQLLIDHLRECPEKCRNIVLQPEIILRASAP